MKKITVEILALFIFYFLFIGLHSPFNLLLMLKFLLVFRSVQMMYSSILKSLPSNQEHLLSICHHNVSLLTETQLTKSPKLNKEKEDQLVVQNYYCLQQDQKLVKVTVIRIGQELITLTDRLSLRRESSPEEDNKTKTSSNSTSVGQQTIVKRKNYLCNAAKNILNQFEKWLQHYYSENGLMLAQLKKMYKSERQLITAVSYNQQLRELFLSFSQQQRHSSSKGSEKMLQKWIQQCQIADQEHHKNQDFIDQMLVQN